MYILTYIKEAVQTNDSYSPAMNELNKLARTLKEQGRALS